MATEGDYTEESWSDGDELTAAQATEMSRELEEQDEAVHELAYAETASTATFTTALVDYAGLSIAVPLSTDRPIFIEADLGLVSDNTGGYHVLAICKADNTVLQTVVVTTVAGPLPDVPAPALQLRLAAGTAAATYKVRIGAQAAGGTLNAQPATLGYTHKAFIRATH